MHSAKPARAALCLFEISGRAPTGHSAPRPESPGRAQRPAERGRIVRRSVAESCPYSPPRRKKNLSIRHVSVPVVRIAHSALVVLVLLLPLNRQLRRKVLI